MQHDGGRNGVPADVFYEQVRNFFDLAFGMRMKALEFSLRRVFASVSFYEDEQSLVLQQENHEEADDLIPEGVKLLHCIDAEMKAYGDIEIMHPDDAAMFGRRLERIGVRLESFCGQYKAEGSMDLLFMKGNAAHFREEAAIVPFTATRKFLESVVHDPKRRIEKAAVTWNRPDESVLRRAMLQGLPRL